MCGLIGIIIGLLTRVALASSLDVGTSPAILFSTRLSEGILEYYDMFDSGAVVPREDFNTVCKTLISHCNSDAVVFVNQPGLSLGDLSEYADQFQYLSSYVRHSSSAMNIERVSVSQDDQESQFESLVRYAMDTCNIYEKVVIEPYEADTYKAYIDAEKKVILIELPEFLNTHNETDRMALISSNDNRLRNILGQLPSPDISVIYTSFQPSNLAADEFAEILPAAFDVFDKNAAVERNIRLKDATRPGFVSYRPKFGDFNSISQIKLDKQFLEENLGLLSAILVSTILYLFGQRLSSQSKSQNTTSNSAKNTTKKAEREN